MSDARDWRWVDASGGRHVWQTETLRSALASGELPLSTLVWCEGMTDWLPASQVPELTAAMPPARSKLDTLPGIADSAPGSSQASKTRVGVPADPALVAQAAQSTAQGRSPTGTTLLGVPPPSPGSGPMPPDVPRLPRHAVLPPPQRKVPPAEETATEAPPSTSEPSLDPTHAHPIIVPGYERPEGRSLITHPPLFYDEAAAAYLRESVRASRLSLDAFRPEEPEQGTLPPLPDARPLPPLPKRSAISMRTAGIALGGVAALLCALGLLRLLLGSSDESIEPHSHGGVAPSASLAIAAPSAPASTGAASVVPAVSASAPVASMSAAPSPAAMRCIRAGEPRRLAPRASKDVPVELSASKDTARMAIGFSADGQTPMGLEIAPATLAVSRAAVPRAAGKLRRVVPVPHGNGYRWLVDAEPAQAKVARAVTVPIEPRFVVGFEGNNVVAADSLTSSPMVLWGLDGGEALRAVAEPSSVLLAIKTKQALYLGELDEHREPVAPLQKLIEAKQLGAPSLARSGQRFAVALAARDANDGWQVRMAGGALGDEASVVTRPFTPPAGGPGGDATSPSLTWLSSEQMLLTWTEGKPGARVVRAQVLSESLEPAAEAIDISPPGANAGQAVVIAGQEHVLVTYLTSSGRQFELWGAHLSCH